MSILTCHGPLGVAQEVELRGHTKKPRHKKQKTDDARTEEENTSDKI